jgi:hypothetical protein
MKLLRDTFLLRAMRRLLAGRRDAVRRSYTVTVPAPLERACASNVIELHRRTRRRARVRPPRPSRCHLPYISHWYPVARWSQIRHARDGLRQRRRRSGRVCGQTH